MDKGLGEGTVRWAEDGAMTGIKIDDEHRHCLVRFGQRSKSESRRYEYRCIRGEIHENCGERSMDTGRCFAVLVWLGEQQNRPWKPRGAGTRT